MVRIFRRKLLIPAFPEALMRPRLLSATVGARVLVAQAPAGAGKTVFLAQWQAARGRPAVWYELDGEDRSGRVFCAHLLDGLRRAWTDWSPPPAAAEDPGELAVELVTEAGARAPLDLVLDRLESAFGEAWLADFLAVLHRYAPPGLTLAMGTRAPLPAGVSGRVVTAAELAFTPDEAREWLGAGAWDECLRTSGGLPLALSLWSGAEAGAGAGWEAELAARARAGMPPHITPERGRVLVEDWLAGRMDLSAFAFQVACAPPGAEQLWGELHDIRSVYLQGEFRGAQTRLDQLWEMARGRGDKALVGAVALLRGETYYGLGEYDQALEWYRQAFDADPALETTGTHSMVLILRDQGFTAEAEALGRRCVAASAARGDLQALSFAKMQYGWMCTFLGRTEEGERELEEAQRLGFQSPEPLYGLIALIHRAGIASMVGNATAFRRLAEEAYTVARGRSPWLEALAGYVFAGALLRWGDRELAGRLVTGALQTLVRIDCKYQVHMLLSIAAQAAWVDGRREEARRQFDQALTLAAAQGYVYILAGEGYQLRPLIIDALVRGVEVAFCQRVLVQQGARSLPSLLDLTGSPDAAARRAALYPLAAIGGEEAVAAIRRLLHDEDEHVRDSALLALKSLGHPTVAVQDAAEAAPEPVAATTGVRVRAAVVGPFAVTVDGKPVQGWRTTKARDLLAFLLIGGDRPYSREQLGEALWPDGDPEAVTRLLHTSLHHLRRALGPAGESLVTFAGGAYRLNRDGLENDLDRFQALTGARDEQSWRATVALCRGELLEGLDYIWCEGPRARVRGAFQETLRRLAAHLIQAERWAEATEFLQYLIESDPLAEDGHIGLMQCYAALGNRGAAVQQYRALARVLDDELGVEPGARAQELYRRLID
ncbi:MAG TPA: BTAD domain-containing putative transcriptional regulator [Symbiobacteriaceae bacterium]|nr:BTAD domain-containing putative transcriptional regulator [Symbiobacteriaceae bacterium]